MLLRNNHAHASLLERLAKSTEQELTARIYSFLLAYCNCCEEIAAELAQSKFFKNMLESYSEQYRSISQGNNELIGNK